MWVLVLNGVPVGLYPTKEMAKESMSLTHPTRIVDEGACHVMYKTGDRIQYVIPSTIAEKVYAD